MPALATDHDVLRLANWSTPFSTCCAAARLGGCCRMTSRPSRRSTTICAAGRPRASGSASITPCWSLTVSGWGARPARRRRSSTASRCAPLIKKGLSRLRRGQEDHRPQETHPDRYGRTPVVSSGPRRQRAGPRRGQAAVARAPAHVVLRGNSLRRWRIRREAHQLGQRKNPSEAENHQATARPATLRAVAAQHSYALSPAGAVRGSP